MISSLRYCNLHNLSIPLTNSEIKTESSASNFIKYFCITEKQSLLPLLQTHAERKNWESVEQLLIVKVIQFSVFFVFFFNLYFSHLLEELYFIFRRGWEVKN